MKSIYTIFKGFSGWIPSKFAHPLGGKIKKFAFLWHGAIIVAPAVAVSAIAIRMLGWLQPLELAALDANFRLRPTEPADDRIVIVAVEESDLAYLKQWPLSDAMLAKLLTQIQQDQPKVIGLDLYRNLPVPPGHSQLTKVFKTTPPIIGIQKVVGDRYSSEVPPSPVLAKLGQVGANDIVVDEDGVLRRLILFPIPGEPLPSLGLALAMTYLNDKGIAPTADSKGYMKLGKTVFTPFAKNDGGYVGADAGGYQILLNFRGPARSFTSVSVKDVLENRIPANLMRDRIVLVGAKATSLNDSFYTPYSRSFLSTPVRTSGVEIQANIASQILSSALEGRPSIQVWNDTLENFWIFLWALLIASLGWKLRNTKALFFLFQITGLLLVTVVSVSILGYVSFLLGWWIPVVPPILTLLGATIVTSSYVYVSRLRELNTNLEQTVQDLEQTLRQLEQSQIQLIQSEKMSSLGQLVSGVAHEINNPVNFISGNIKYLQDYYQDLTNHLQLYQQTFPNPGNEIKKDAEAIDLEYLLEDLPKIAVSMETGIKRIEEICISLRTFSRGDTSNKVPFNIHEGIDSTLLILKHRIKGNSDRPEIKIVKEYASLPMVNCYPGQLNQVFMNLIANAIDALDDSKGELKYQEIQANPHQITIITEVLADKNNLAIRIKDNGLGMSSEVKEKIFQHLFTTKAVGKGTGLGLSISRQIVEETHGGKLSCISTPGKGAEFIIEIPVIVVVD